MGKWINSLTGEDIRKIEEIEDFRGIFKTADGDTVIVTQADNMWGDRNYYIYTDFDRFLAFSNKKIFPAYPKIILSKIVGKWKPNYSERKDIDYPLTDIFYKKVDIGYYQSERLEHEQEVHEILAQQKAAEIKAKDEMLNENKRKLGIKR